MSEPDDIAVYEEADNIYQNTQKEEGEITEDEMTRQEAEQYEKQLEAQEKEKQGIQLKELVQTFDGRVKKLAGATAKEAIKHEKRRRRSLSRSGDRGGRPPDQQKTFLKPLRESKDKLGKAQKPIQVLRQERDSLGSITFEVDDRYISGTYKMASESLDFIEQQMIQLSLVHDHISKNIREPFSNFKIKVSDPYDSIEESSLNSDLSKQIQDEVKRILVQEERKTKDPKRASFVTEAVVETRPSRKTSFVTEAKAESRPSRKKKEIIKKDDSDSDEQFFDSRGPSDDESAVSRSSIFTEDKSEILINSLLEAKEYAEDVKINYSDKSTLVKEALLQIKQVMVEVKEKAPKVKAPPIKQEKIEDLYHDIKKLKKDLLQCEQDIYSLSEKKKLAPRLKFPQFNGNVLTFHSFISQMDDLTQHLSEKDKIRELLNNIDTKARKEYNLSSLIDNTSESYEAVKSQLNIIFGQLNSVIPGEYRKILELQSPQSLKEEISNITSIVSFYQFLKAHNKTDHFDESLQLAIRDKIREKWSDQLDLSPPKSKEEFIDKLNIFQQINYREARRKPDDVTAGFDGGIGTRSNMTNIQTGATPIKCFICQSSHYTKGCSEIRDKNLPEIYDVLKNRKKCGVCFIQMEDGYKDHKTKCKTKRLDRKTGKWLNKVCQYCNSGLNSLICPCRQGRSGAAGRGAGQRGARGGGTGRGGGGRGAGRGSAPAPAGAAPQSDHGYSKPAAAGQTEQKSEQEAPGPVNIVGNNVTSVNVNTVRINGVPLGGAVCPAQKLVIQGGPSNKQCEILAIYDSWSESTFISNNVKNIDLFEKFPVSVNCLNTKKPSLESARRASFQVIGDQNTFFVEAVFKEMTNDRNPLKTITIPESWRQKYGLGEKFETSSLPTTLIIGTDLTELFPTEIAREGKIKLYKSVIDGEYILSGYDNEYQNTDNIVKNFRTTLNNTMSSFDSKWLQYHQLDPTKILPQLCRDCRGKPECSACKLQLTTKTELQIFEESKLEDGISYDENQRRFYFKNCFSSEFDDLPTYKSDVLTYMKGFEQRMKKKPQILEGLNKSIQKNINQEKWQYESQVFANHPEMVSMKESFAPLNFAQKESNITKVRPVINFSFKQNGKPALNDVCFKGSSLNHKIADILLRIRSFKWYGQSDIDDFYNQIRVHPETANLSKILFKKEGLGSQGDFEPLISFCLQIGLTSSQFVANCCKLKCSKMFIKPKNQIADTFISWSYTDDLHCASNESIADAKQIARDIEVGLNQGGFSLKEWKFGGDECGGDECGERGGDPAHGGRPPDHSHGPVTAGAALQPDNNNCRPAAGGAAEQTDEEEILTARHIAADGRDEFSLGIKFLPRSDSWKVFMKINFSPKLRGTRNSRFTLNTTEEVNQFFATQEISKRQCLRVCHSIWDPLGLLLSLRINLFLLYREVLQKNPNLGYEEKIDQESKKKLQKIVHQIIECRDMKFSRWGLCSPTDNDLCVTVDGSGCASAVRVFSRAKKLPPDKDDEKPFLVKYLYGNGKLAPLGPQAAAKTETDSILLGLRIIEWIISICSHMDFKNIYLFSDSTIALGGLCSKHVQMKLFYASRFHEMRKILQKFPQIKIFKVPGEQNDADCCSKMHLDRNHALTSVYWKSYFLELDSTQWPTEEYKYSPEHVQNILNPKVVVKSFQISVNQEEISKLAEKYHSFDKICRIVAFLLKFKTKFTDYFQQAKQILLSLQFIKKSEIEGVQRQYKVTKEKSDLCDQFYLISRPFIFGNKEISERLIFVSREFFLAKHILMDAHIHCSDPSQEIANLHRRGFFIPGARTFFKRYQNSCLTCRKIRHEAVQASLGVSRQLQAANSVPPLAISTWDIKGPLRAKISRNVSEKIYILTISCIWSRYTVLQPLFSLSSDSILTALQCAAHQVGGAIPRILYSDSGTSLLPIGNIGPEAEQNLNVENILSTLKNNNIRIISSNHAPWRQTFAESLHRIISLIMKRTNLFKKSFSVSQWNFIVAKIQFALNSRVLNIKYENSSLQSVTPINLVFGNRKELFPANLHMDLSGNKLFRNFESLEQELKAFRNLWFSTYGQSLKNWTKWKKSNSDQLKVGSIVLVLDKLNKETNFFVIGRIVEILSERTFKIEYNRSHAKLDKNMKIIKSSTKSIFERPAQQLCYLFTPTEKSDNQNIENDENSQEQNFNVDPFYIPQSSVKQSAFVQDEFYDVPDDQLFTDI